MWSDNSNSNDENDCRCGDFKELYKQKCHTALPFCRASISELEIQMCINQCPPPRLASYFFVAYVRENVATKARCGCSGTMHWNYSILAAILMTSKISILLLQMFNKRYWAAFLLITDATQHLLQLQQTQTFAGIICLWHLKEFSIH